MSPIVERIEEEDSGDILVTFRIPPGPKGRQSVRNYIIPSLDRQLSLWVTAWDYSTAEYER